MPIDLNRQRKTYSYTRVQPRYQEAQIIIDETLDWKNSVRAASTGTHALTGATPLTVGGVSLANEDRVLLKNQSSASQNGIYYYVVSGGNYTLERASDVSQETISCGAATYVEEGTNGGKIYILSTPNPITVDSTSLTWTEFSSGGGGGGGNDYWVSTTDGAIYATGSVAIRGGLGSVDAATDIGTDVFLFVSGSITGSGANDKKAVFGGDVRMSGSLEVSGDQVEITGSLRVTNGISGSLTKLTDGTSYLIAGPNITINTGSNGAVQITGSAGGGGVSGTGTANYIPKFSTSTALSDSILQEGNGINYIGSNSTFLTSSGYGITFPNAQIWSFPSNLFALDINGKFKFDTFSGNLGIGTPSSAAQKIHVAINNDSTSNPIVNDSTSIIRFQNFDTTSNNSTSIINADGNGGDINSYIQFINVDHFSNKGALAFGTRNGASSGTRIRIDEDGNVGIGSVTPTSVGADVFLFVSGSSGSLGTTDRGVTAFGGDVIVSGSLKIGTESVTLTSNNIQFGSTSMRVEKNGNDMKFFDISNPSGLTLSELAVGGGGGSSPEYWSSPSSGFIYSTGSVGIGTSSPGARLDILSADGGSSLIIKQGSTAPAVGVPIIQAKGYGGATVLWVSGSGGINSRVGIGTTNPRETCMLDVGIKGSTATNNYVGVNAGLAGECGISWSANGSELWKLKRAGTDLALVELNTNNIALLCEYTSGNVGINTSKPEDKLHVDTGNIKVDTAGYGVRLASSPSNGDAQTLDSYYEVTVTSVALRDDTGDYAMAAGYNSLKMTRIGRLVTLSGHLRIDTGTKPSGSGRLKINMTSASPVPPVASNKTAASVWITSFTSGLTYPIQAYMDTSDSLIYVDGFNAGAYVNLGPYLDSSSDVIVSVTYVAA